MTWDDPCFNTSVTSLKTFRLSLMKHPRYYKDKMTIIFSFNVIWPSSNSFYTSIRKTFWQTNCDPDNVNPDPAGNGSD